ncbi:MAG: glycosyltransferase [Chloroflexota bacterium]
MDKSVDLEAIRQGLIRIRGDPSSRPDGSVVIPVNAAEDLGMVLQLLNDLVGYSGRYRFEVVLVVNNYSPEHPPEEIEGYRHLGANVLAVPEIQSPGIEVILGARLAGMEVVHSEKTIHFDADCRIPNINALFDWIMEAFKSGAQLAYSHVSYYDFLKIPSVYTRIAVHHLIRWIKRNLLGIPTTRGSNYAIDRSLFLALARAGKISVDFQVGPEVKACGAQIAYTDHPDMRVLTSGRKIRGGWFRFVRYLLFRLRVNLKSIPSQSY